MTDNGFDIDSIRRVLNGHEPQTADLRSGLRPAAVLAPFYQGPDGLSLIFTKRTAHLKDHSSQISFPGGGREEHDPDLLTTALRETEEEIGVSPADIDIWGRLNQQITITGYSVAPFVGQIRSPYDFRLDPHEVDRLIIVPVAHLTHPENRSWEYYEWRGNKYKSYLFPYKDDVIWGATARMVHNLLTLVETGEEPVEIPRLRGPH